MSKDELIMENGSQPDWKSEFEALRALSARIGNDPGLTQAAGGNTSLKVGDVLWIKASGTWLAHALERDIMVPVQMQPLIDAVRRSDPVAEQAQRFTISDQNPSGLRPSIETTVHALMPQKVVLHVHCVDTIALAIRTDCEVLLKNRLKGLNWAYVHYARPGLPLALAIAEHSHRRPDVLVLGNHGLAVAAETVAEAEALLTKVKGLLHADARVADAPDLQGLSTLIGDSGYRLPAASEAHAVAIDATNTAIAAKGSLYPDHVIFLGVGSVVAEPGEDVAAVQSRLGTEPVSILFPGQGALMRGDANPGADAMARCLSDVLARVPADAPVRYLTAEENLQLTDWDAEKYRQELNRKAAAVAGA